MTLNTMKNPALSLAATTLAASLPLLSCHAAAETPASRPNIVILLADDLGYGDLSCNGNTLHETPNIDRLSREEARFSRFYTAPISSPTRTGLLTGMFPSRLGLRDNVCKPWLSFGMDTQYETMADVLGQAGYSNRAIVGKWHLGSSAEYWPTSRGFTHFYGCVNGAIDYFLHERDGQLDWHNDRQNSYDKGYSTDLIADHAVSCIENYVKDGPFFLYVAFNAPHEPLQAKDADIQYYAQKMGKNMDALTPAEKRKATYAAMVGCLDQGVGRIIAQLKRSNLWDNTMVLFFSDNGPIQIGTTPYRGKKNQEFDGGLRAPAYMHWPGVVKGNSDIAQLTGFIDILPTLRDYLGITDKPKYPYDGISVLSVLNGSKENIVRDLYLGRGAMVSQNFKFIFQKSNPSLKLQHDFLCYYPNNPLEERNEIGSDDPIFKAEAARLAALTAELDRQIPENRVDDSSSPPQGYVPMKNWNPFGY